MTKEWISSLVQEIKQNGHESAENYSQSQHRSQVITTKGQPFFSALIIALEEDVNEIRTGLQGDVTSSDTLFQKIGPTEVKLTRKAFPWFDVRVTYRDPVVILDYAKGLGVAGDPTVDRKTCHFTFQVDTADNLFVQPSFDEKPVTFTQAEDLAQHITELLFKP
ncbi:MAG TPA: hypothetical protein VNU92_09775 [Edaphobacter sp.]|jgi:hypothetical protein|nr:hypothetical protein [Edaphobacter sp.]